MRFFRILYATRSIFREEVVVHSQNMQRVDYTVNLNCYSQALCEGGLSKRYSKALFKCVILTVWYTNNS